VRVWKVTSKNPKKQDNGYWISEWKTTSLCFSEIEGFSTAFVKRLDSVSRDVGGTLVIALVKQSVYRFVS
jgi:hypothetical protein